MEQINIGGNKQACAFILGESFTPGGVTHTLGRNDRGVTLTGESFIPLTPASAWHWNNMAVVLLQPLTVNCGSIYLVRQNTLTGMHVVLHHGFNF